MCVYIATHCTSGSQMAANHKWITGLFFTALTELKNTAKCDIKSKQDQAKNYVAFWHILPPNLVRQIPLWTG